MQTISSTTDEHEANLRWAGELVRTTRQEIAKLTDRFVTADEHHRALYRDAIVASLRELSIAEEELARLQATTNLPPRHP